MIGSHLDTVVDAGRYDGGLGVLAAHRRGGGAARPAERLGARRRGRGLRRGGGLALSHPYPHLIGPDRRRQAGAAGGQGYRRHHRARGARGGRRRCRAPIAPARAPKGEIAAYLELHIEQGPVLEAKGLALGAVTAINGSVRSMVTVTGFAGHAGTVPMGARRDALTARQRDDPGRRARRRRRADLVATVGRINVLPGARTSSPAASSSPSTCAGPSDAVRDRAHAALLARLAADRQAARRRLDIDTFQREPGTSP